MKHRSLISLGIIFVCLFANCCNDASENPSDTRCHATYVIDETSETCLFGQCDKYDSILREHYCPTNASLCIKDEKGRFYCGSTCPEGKLENRSAEEFSSMCTCSIEHCLNDNSNKGWKEAQCTEDDNCIAIKCEDKYILHDGDCLDSIDCCGNNCDPCTKSDGWESGSCKDGKCIADKCKKGFHTYNDDNGNVYCQIDTSDACGETGDVCPPTYICNQEKATCECAPELTECNTKCYNLLTETDHCGSCDTICNVANAENYCNEGECQFTCKEGYTASEDNTVCIEAIECSNDETICDGKCVNLLTSNDHCGSCYNSCKVGQCKAGICQCEDNKADCSGKCIDLTNDPNNCGSCGYHCESGQCKESKCQCKDNQTDCNGKCIELTTNDNCGECGKVCPAGQMCLNKECKCPTGKINCSGICIDPSTDSNNCGECGKICSGGKTCNNNNCTCPSNETECDGTCVDLTTNSNHCGSCEKSCNGSCIDSKCQCKGDQILCNSDCISASHKGVVVSLSGWPCREEPNNTSTTIDNYEYGQSVSIFGIKNGWFVTRCKDHKGYLNSEYVFMMPTRGLVTANNGIKVYQDYNKTGEPTTLEKETHVTIIDFKIVDSTLWFQLSEPEGFTDESYFISRLSINGDDRDKLQNCSE